MFMNEIARTLLANLKSKGWTSRVIVIGKKSVSFTYEQPFEHKECFEFLESILKGNLDSLVLHETSFEVTVKD